MVAPFRIDDFEDADQAAFERLNMEWIERWFEVEQPDRETLGDPRRKILDPGGHVLLARDAHGTVVGTCALLAIAAERGGGFELAKMAVAESVRGQGLGERLGRAAIERARECGASRIFLESSTRLPPAITLYEKLGFVRLEGMAPSPYTRCDIQMELTL